jgi:glycine cleavage system H protein
VRPEELLFTRTHEWVRFERAADGSQIATMGITAFALEALTDLTYLELAAPGTQVTAGQPCGEIESVKAVSDLYSPVTGEVIEANLAARDKLELLNQDPYGSGWLLKIRTQEGAARVDLLDYAAYQRQCAEEPH